MGFSVASLLMKLRPGEKRQRGRWRPGWRYQKGPGRGFLFRLAKVSKDAIYNVADKLGKVSGPFCVQSCPRSKTIVGIPARPKRNAATDPANPEPITTACLNAGSGLDPLPQPTAVAAVSGAELFKNFRRVRFFIPYLSARKQMKLA